MIDGTHRLAITRRAKLLALSRASEHYARRPVPAGDLIRVRLIDGRVAWLNLSGHLDPHKFPKSHHGDERDALEKTRQDIRPDTPHAAE